MGLVWTAAADNDLDNIALYIGRENRSAAIKVLQQVEACAEGLLKNPRIGKPGREPDTRERAVLKTPFVMIYELSGAKIIILRVLHGAQEWPSA